MVDTLLLIACALSVVIWFVQEKFARPQLFQSVKSMVVDGVTLPAQQICDDAMPAWNKLLLTATSLVWLAWVASVVFIKDGDFAFVLVMLTLLSGLIVALDNLLFKKARSEFVASSPVKSFFDKYDAQQRESLDIFFSKDMLVGEYARSFFPVLALVLVVRSFIIEPFQIPSGSMIPTLKVGDYIVVNKYEYGLRLPVLKTKILEVNQPQRGDVIVFFPPNQDIYYIKRLIGMPGDQLTYKNKTLYINGEELSKNFLANIPDAQGQINTLFEEAYGDKSYLTNNVKGAYRREADEVSVTVKEGHYFMMGDNRDNSADSRSWGQVPEDRIVGKAFAIWMHWPKITQFPSFKRAGTFE